MKPMKPTVFAIFLAMAAGAGFAGMAQAATFDRTHSKYCESNAFDPLCMDSKQLTMRTQMLAMDDSKVMDYRTHYCTEHRDDAACQGEFMKTISFVKGFAGANTKYCESNVADPICMDEKMFDMRKKVLAMNKAAIMDNRKKFCAGNGADAMCHPEVMQDETGM